jgi:hypothetical protein
MRTVLVVKVGRSYGPLQFLGDVFMTVITGGLWLIYVLVRH